MLYGLYSFQSSATKATKLYFMYYLCVVIIFLSTGSCKSVFSISSFVKLGFRVSVFWFLRIEFNVISYDLITFVESGSIINNVLFNFVLTLYKQSTKIWESCYKKTCIQRRFEFIEKNSIYKWKTWTCTKTKISHKN